MIARSSHRLRLALVLSLVASCVPESHPPATDILAGLRVDEIDPAPNYRHASVSQARKHLVDGIEERFPLWVRSGGVSWTRLTPAAIALEWSGPTRAGRVEVHVARGDYAGVGLPRRIDVYARTASGTYRHAGVLEIGPEDLDESTQGWLGASFDDAWEGLAVVIHGRKHLISIDEIRIRRANRDAVPAVRGASELPDLEAVRADGAARLRESLYSRAPCRYPAAARSAPRRDWRAAILEPYAELPPCGPGPALERLSGFGFETEPFVLHLENGSDRAREFRIEVPAHARSDISVERLGAILSADGRLVLDAIEPVTPASIRLGRGEVAHLWVEVRLSSLPAGAGLLAVRVREHGGASRDLELPTRIASLNVRAKDRMDGVAWSTLSPPIWSDFEDARRALARGGGTVFMIPPWYVPVVHDAASTPRGRQRFREQMASLARDGLVLVQLGVIRRLGGCRGAKAAGIERRMKQLVALVREAGVPFSRWAVYPTDEAHDEKLEELLACARAIERADPRIQIYANPTRSKDTARARKLLESLAPHIDIWQPRAMIVKGPLAEFFRRQKTFWIYDNPREPVKSDSPHFYRALSWRAHALGATGTGFWGFDDTRRSSAWDDFDGTRPDWGVMYEGQTGPVPSRRWRAFSDGLEDAAALSALSRVRGLARERVRAARGMPACRISPRFAAGACRDALVGAVLEGETDP